MGVSPKTALHQDKDVQISSEDQETIVRGRIDILICQPQFWIVVIEAKRAEYSLKVGIPQALAYMLANPELQKPAFGFVTSDAARSWEGSAVLGVPPMSDCRGFPHERLHQDNGGEFIFLKLIRKDKPQYAFSNQFSVLNRGNDLYTVARILKHLGQLVRQ